MATVTVIKAVSRSRGGKGAARAERRAGRVPGIIYGDGKPPLPISLDFADLRQRIYAGRFLTTIHDVSFRRHPRWFPLKHALLLNALAERYGPDALAPIRA